MWEIANLSLSDLAIIALMILVFAIAVWLPRRSRPEDPKS